MEAGAQLLGAGKRLGRALQTQLARMRLSSGSDSPADPGAPPLATTSFNRSHGQSSNLLLRSLSSKPLRHSVDLPGPANQGLARSHSQNSKCSAPGSSAAITAPGHHAPPFLSSEAPSPAAVMEDSESSTKLGLSSCCSDGMSSSAAGRHAPAARAISSCIQQGLVAQLLTPDVLNSLELPKALEAPHPAAAAPLAQSVAGPTAAEQFASACNVAAPFPCQPSAASDDCSGVNATDAAAAGALPQQPAPQPPPFHVSDAVRQLRQRQQQVAVEARARRRRSLVPADGLVMRTGSEGMMGFVRLRGMGAAHDPCADHHLPSAPCSPQAALYPASPCRRGDAAPARGSGATTPSHASTLSFGRASAPVPRLLDELPQQHQQQPQLDEHMTAGSSGGAGFTSRLLQVVGAIAGSSPCASAAAADMETGLWLGQMLVPSRPNTGSHELTYLSGGHDMMLHSGAFPVVPSLLDGQVAASVADGHHGFTSGSSSFHAYLRPPSGGLGSSDNHAWVAAQQRAEAPIQCIMWDSYSSPRCRPQAASTMQHRGAGHCGKPAAQLLQELRADCEAAPAAALSVVQQQLVDALWQLVEAKDADLVQLLVGWQACEEADARVRTQLEELREHVFTTCLF